MKRVLRAFSLALALFSLTPISVQAQQVLIPVGTVVGLQLKDDTVTVAAFDDRCPAARNAGIQIGDELIQIDNTAITSTEDVRSALNDCDGKITMTLRRNGTVSTLHITPEAAADGPKLGVYLRQGISGIGTVTFYDPETGKFGTLGHGVNDGKGKLLSMKEGFAFEAKVESVAKGKPGEPGQLKGSADSLSVLGAILQNTPQGVFGINPSGWQGTAIPTATYDQIHTGEATIRCTVSGTQVQEYSVEILKLYSQDKTDGRNFLLKVTDPDLLSATGGIVQGMSGSPIIQDGKLVGAVTHVLVNDPTRGYGIFIENMLDAAG